MISLEGLNTEQRIAAETIEGPLLILAGAGSGKTRTVTYRIANMISNLNIPAPEILALSFTNKAATEMRDRVKKLLSAKQIRGITLSTFHSLGIRILREDIEKLGYSKDFVIYDSADQLSIVREALKYLKAEKAFDKKEIQSRIGFLKNNGIGVEDFANSSHFDPDDPYDMATDHVYHFYMDKLHFYNAVDFDDILFLVVKLFKQFPAVAKKYSEQFKYIMIDEYQDTNGLQFQMVSGLTSTHSNICVVGDDDQSIYAFRGADITNILNFEKQYENTTVIKLEQNYRSTAKILNLANKVIKENTHRKDKTMRSEILSGELPKLWACGNTDHEAQIVADEAVKHQLAGRHLGDIAVLYRSNTQLPPFEDQFRLNQIPYIVIGGQKFYDKKEIKDLIAYLSVIYNPKDELSLRRILNVPNRGIGTQTLNKLLTYSREHQKPLFYVIEEKAHEIVDKKKADKLQAFIRLIREFKGNFLTMNLVQATHYIVEKIDYFEFIGKSYDSPKIASHKKDDVRSFLLSTERFYDRFGVEATLQSYLQRLLLADSQDKRNSTEEGLIKNEVTFMTLHSSKGLEFDTVYLVGMEEESLPHKNTIREGTDVSEERRLAYVGITRAKRKLIMTYAKERKIYGKQLKRFKSRFVNEIYDDLMLEQDRTSFGHMTEEQAQEYKKDFFSDLLASLDE